MCYQLSESVNQDERQKQACWAQARVFSCRPPSGDRVKGKGCLAPRATT